MLCGAVSRSASGDAEGGVQSCRESNFASLIKARQALSWTYSGGEGDRGSTVVKVAGSIPAGASGFFIDIKSFRSHYGPGVDSVCSRYEYQEYFPGVKAAGA